MVVSIKNIEEIKRRHKISQEQLRSEELAIISICETGENPPNIADILAPDRGDGVLNEIVVSTCAVIFDDVEQGEPNCITDTDAKAIALFVARHKDSAKQIIIQCEAAPHRASGVAAAILMYYNGNASPIFSNAKSCPNMACYNAVLSALQDMPEAK